MDQETALLSAILAAPDDEVARLALADWLEERGRWPGDWRSAPKGCGHQPAGPRRVGDLRLRGKPFRVTRCDACGGRLTAHRITEGKFSAFLPDSAFPGPLPLSRDVALEALGRPDDFNATGGKFLSFVMVPLEERVGEYRFAGASRSLAGAFRRVEEFADAMQFATLLFPDREFNGLLRSLLGEMDLGDEYSYPREAPVRVAGPHRLILCVQSGAPYEGLGACVVEIPWLAGSPYDQRPPETDFPEEWREGAIDWVLEQGAERFGPVPAEVEAAIRAETRPEVWGGWLPRWKDIRGWQELMAGSSRGRRGAGRARGTRA
jgi:uncharacterized protein (TIGR02996 family)